MGDIAKNPSLQTDYFSHHYHANESPLNPIPLKKHLLPHHNQLYHRDYLSQESYADLILMKLMRIRQILTNDGKTLISEGIDANFVDILNYAVFALIQIGEGKH